MFSFRDTKLGFCYQRIYLPDTCSMYVQEFVRFCLIMYVGRLQVIHFTMGDGNNMSLSPITEGLPDELRMQLLTEEQVYYFSYIAFKGGCLSSSSRSNYWISLSNKRILYKAKVSENNNQKLVEKDGIIPLDKISFMEVSEESTKSGCGCSNVKAFHLKIGSSGNTVVIPLPTKDKGYEVRKVYSEITNA